MLPHLAPVGGKGGPISTLPCPVCGTQGSLLLFLGLSFVKLEKVGLDLYSRSWEGLNRECKRGVDLQERHTHHAGIDVHWHACSRECTHIQTVLESQVIGIPITAQTAWHETSLPVRCLSLAWHQGRAVALLPPAQTP
jgi:hypothetical protein